MLRSKKEEQVAFLREALADVEGLVVTGMQGLTVAEISDLRRRLHEAGVQYKVVKNNLFKRVAAEGDLNVVADAFKGPTAIAWSTTDAVAPAKITVEFQKDVSKFEIKAGFVSGNKLDVAQVEALSKLPSLDELRSKLLGTVNGVAAKLLAQINAPASHVVGVIEAKRKKDEEEAA